jgi:hypothetical protein
MRCSELPAPGVPVLGERTLQLSQLILNLPRRSRVVSGFTAKSELS